MARSGSCRGGSRDLWGQKPARPALFGQSGAGQASVPVSWRPVDRAQDLGGKGSDRGGEAAKVGKEFHKTRVAFVPNSEESQSTNRAANGQAAVRTLFAHACRLGLEGIVSKRKDSLYRSGRSPDWLR